MRQNRDGVIQAWGTLTFSDQEAQKHSKSRRALFRRCPPSLLTVLQDKLSQVLCVKPARFLSKASQ
jgi:hypothetical protein